MLRRNFIKSVLTALAGIMVMGRMPLAGHDDNNIPSAKIKNRILPLRGHGRSGCASRPELATILGDGICCLPD